MWSLSRRKMLPRSSASTNALLRRFAVERPAEFLQTRHATSRYHLRLHRARSVILTPQELVEIRAAQRTFEGAYIRTSLSQFSFALVVLKIFTSEFYSIGRHIFRTG